MNPSDARVPINSETRPVVVKIVEKMMMEDEKKAISVSDCEQVEEHLTLKHSSIPLEKSMMRKFSSEGDGL